MKRLMKCSGTILPDRVVNVSSLCASAREVLKKMDVVTKIVKKYIVRSMIIEFRIIVTKAESIGVMN